MTNKAAEKVSSTIYRPDEKSYKSSGKLEINLQALKYKSCLSF